LYPFWLEYCSTLLSIQRIVFTVVSHLFDTTLLTLPLTGATQRDYTFVLYTSAAGYTQRLLYTTELSATEVYRPTVLRRNRARCMPSTELQQQHNMNVISAK